MFTVFPSALYTTYQCPDILALSIDSNQALLVECTLSWEETNNWKKQEDTQELILSLKIRGLRTNFSGCWSKRATRKINSLPLEKYGLLRQNRNKFIERISKAAAEASFIIWLKKGWLWGGCEASVESLESKLRLH